MIWKRWFGIACAVFLLAACSSGSVVDRGQPGSSDITQLVSLYPGEWAVDKGRLIVGPTLLQNATALVLTTSGALCEVMDLGTVASGSELEDAVNWWIGQIPSLTKAFWITQGSTKVLFVEDVSSVCASHAATFLGLTLGGTGVRDDGAMSISGSDDPIVGDTIVISSDLPLQGSARAANESTNKAIELYLEQIGYRVGNYRIEFETYDNATPAKGSWDDATCAVNALDHVANSREVAVIGTYNSGCAKIIVPVLNQSRGGPMLMVSHANTNPGLTKPWDFGEPEKYYPMGRRNYARVIATDDWQGVAAAQFAAQKLRVKRCFVLNDNQTYGQGVAKAFAEESSRQGINVLGNEAWDASAPSYTALFAKIKALGVDCLYIGGIFDNNGAQLIRDKYQVLGDNSRVKLIGPDGFTGYPDLDYMSQSQGMYLTFAGLSADLILRENSVGARFIEAYRDRYGEDPVGSYALYGVAALQVILEAIEQAGPNLTRAKVVDAVFSGRGITIPAYESVLGREISIDPRTGDVLNREITILALRGRVETTVQAWTVQ